MRPILITLTAFSASIAAASAHEAHTARPGGVYASTFAANADECARTCGEDALCMAWTFKSDGGCELKAVAPAPMAQNGATSGLSSRAPEFARLVATPQPIVPAANEIPSPELRPTTLAAAEIAPDRAPAPSSASDDSGLLGGASAEADAQAATPATSAAPKS
ncbi:MAG: PAN domain-containing protein [Caulobacterales bacterium]